MEIEEIDMEWTKMSNKMYLLI